MKNLKLFLFILISLCWFTDCTKKESFTTYKVSEVKNVGALDCRITATSPGKTNIVYYGDCKTKIGSTLKVQMP
jgi:hypothetical protein